MTVNALIYPMAAMVALTAIVLVRLFRSRVAAVTAGQVSAQFYHLYRGETEPDSSAQVSRHFTNLFEAPTLFYAGCLAAMVSGDTALSALILAWLYVAARIAHSVVHLGANRLRWRIRAYFSSWIALCALWVQIVLHAALA